MRKIPYHSRLLTQVGTIALREKELFGEYFIRLNAGLRAVGLEMAVHDDMTGFERVCRETGKFLPNAFNPAAVPFPPGAGLWMELQDEAGERVATFAVRLFDLGRHTLGDWLSTLSFFYAAPARDMASGERFVLGDEADAYASTVRRHCTYIGGLWLAPAWRGRTGLAEVMTTAGCALALAHWNAAPMVSIAEDEVYAKNASKYRFDEAYPGVRWRRPHKPERSRMWLLGRTRAAVVADVAAFVERPDAYPMGVPQTGAVRMLGEAGS